MDITLRIVGQADTDAIERFKAVIEEMAPAIQRAVGEAQKVQGSAGFDEVAAGVKRVGDEAEKSGGKLASMAEAGKKASLALGAGILAGGAALTVFGAKAVAAASDVAESQNKVNVVFGESRGAIEALAGTAATSLGQTRGQVLEAAGTFGNLLTALGQSQEAAAGMSVDMVKLASDLGSFNNADPTEVLEALRAGLTGEAEPMKRFGVALNEVAMKQAAMKAGLGDNVQALSEAEKMQLRYNIIMEQTKAAQGDFANTSNGMANSVKIIKAGIADATAEIGAGLLPAVEKATAGFTTFLKSAKFDEVKTKVIDAFAAIGDRLASIDWESVADAAVIVFDKIAAAIEFLADNPMIAKIVAVVGLIAAAFGPILIAVGPLIPVFMTIVGAIGGVVTAAGGLGAVLATVAAVLTGPVAIAIAIAIGAFVLWKTKGDEIKAALASMWEGIKAAFTAGVSAVTANVDTIKAVLLTILTGGLILVYNGWVQYGDQIKAKAAEIGAWIGQKWAELKAATVARWNELKAAITGAMDAIKAVISAALAAVRAAWDATWEGLKTAATTVWSVIVDTITGIVSQMIDNIKANVAMVVDVFLFGWDVLMAANQAFWDTFRALVQVGMDFIRGAVRAAMQLLSGDWRGAWETIKGTVSGAVAAVRSILGAFVSYIGSLAGAVLEKARGIGRAIGDGIRQTLENGWKALVDKLSALVSLLPDTVKKLLGIASPSRVFTDIARMILEGLAMGLGDAKLTRQIFDEIAGLAAATASIMESALKAITVIAEFEIPAALDTLGEKFERMWLHFMTFVSQFGKVAEFITRAQENTPAGFISADAKRVVLEFASLVQGVGDAAGRIAEALSKVANADLPAPAKVLQVLDMIGVIAARAEEVGLEFAGALGLQAFKAVGEGIAAAIAVFEKVGSLSLADVTEIAEAQLQAAARNIVGIVDWTRRAAADLAALGTTITPEVAGYLKTWQEGVGAAVDAMRVAAEASTGWDDVAALTADQLRVVAGNIVAIVDWTRRAAGDLAALGLTITPQLAGYLQTWADGIGAAVGAMRDAASAIKELADLDAVTLDVDRIAGVLRMVRDALAPAVLALAEGWQAASKAAADQTARMREFADWIGAAVTLAKASVVGELEATITVNLNAVLGILEYLREDFAPALVAIADAWTVAAEAAALQTERMKGLNDWLGAALGLARASAVGAIEAAITVNANAIAGILEYLRDDFVPDLVAIADAWLGAGEAAKLQVERMKDFAAWIGAALDVAKLAAVGEIKAGITVNLDAIKGVLLYLRNDFVPAIASVLSGWTTSAADAKALGERLGSLGAIIGGAAGILKAVTDMKGGSISAGAIEQAKQAARMVMDAIFGPDGLAVSVSKEAAERGAAAMTALESGAKALSAVGETIMGFLENPFVDNPRRARTSSVSRNAAKTRMEALKQSVIAGIRAAVDALQQAMEGINIQPDDPRTTAIQQLGDAFSALAKGLKEIGETKLPDAARLAAVMAALVVGASPGPAGPAGGAPGAAGSSQPGITSPISPVGDALPGAVGGGPGGGGAVLNATINLTQPVVLDSEQIGVAIEKVIAVHNLRITTAPSGTV